LTRLGRLDEALTEAKNMINNNSINNNNRTRSILFSPTSVNIGFMKAGFLGLIFDFLIVQKKSLTFLEMPLKNRETVTRKKSLLRFGRESETK
jgi:hypothetical protein